jgi:hypothetical protein
MKGISFTTSVLALALTSIASAVGSPGGVTGFPSSVSPVGAPGSYSGNLTAPDPPGRMFPGKYFEYKAQFYLRKGDFAEALREFELAGYWANKRAQYNAAMMYFKGIGVSIDRTRGVAWLGIAAENHDELSLSALRAAYTSLSADEKTQADKIFQMLNDKYGDTVTIARALKQFNVETRNIVGTHTGFGGLNVLVAEVGSDDPSYRPIDYFNRKQGDQLDALIASITGHVTVGQVVTLPVAPPH